MQFFTSIATIIMFCLAVWKLYELCFDTGRKVHKKKDNTQTEILSAFFAEFSYKVMNDNKKYQDAPKEVYKWLQENFTEWAKLRSNKIETIIKKRR